MAFEIRKSTLLDNDAGDGLFTTRYIKKGSRVKIPSDYFVKMNDTDIFYMEDGELTNERLSDAYDIYLRKSLKHQILRPIRSLTDRNEHYYACKHGSPANGNMVYWLFIANRDIMAGEELFRTYGIIWLHFLLHSFDILVDNPLFYEFVLSKCRDDNEIINCEWLFTRHGDPANLK